MPTAVNRWCAVARKASKAIGAWLNVGGNPWCNPCRGVLRSTKPSVFMPPFLITANCAGNCVKGAARTVPLNQVSCAGRTGGTGNVKRYRYGNRVNQPCRCVYNCP